MQKGPRSRYDQELIAQGVGNGICGILGALPMTGVIVRSTANIEAGGKTRGSAILHGIWLLVFVALLPGVLRLIPVCALAALLVYTGYKLVANREEIGKLAHYGKGELFVYAVTLGAIVCTDLLHGVLIGVAVSALRLLAAFVRLDARLHKMGPGRYELMLRGTACFVTLPHLAEILDRVPDGSELHVHLERLGYIDHACLELLSSWERRQEALDGRLVVEWHELEQRYREPHRAAG
jgi:MFS superfamily sulfate permease-like transporter